MNDRLLPKTRIYLFIALLVGAMMAIYGYVGGNKDVTLIGIVVSLATITTTIIFAAHDETLDRMGL